MLPALLEVNANRFKEGARVLEDVARFVLKDLILFNKIKSLKHQVNIATFAKDPCSDIGGPDFKEEAKRLSLIDLVNANGRRMQEAARVLEEIDNREYYKAIRFSAYAIHADLLIKIKNYLHLDKLKGIYAICSPSQYSIGEIASIIEQKKISLCQIRMKSSSKQEIINATGSMRAKLAQTKCLLIINDEIDIALALADGVHLGQNDLPVEMAKKIAPNNFIIGITCHTVKEAQMAERNGASYISVGCMFPTQTKTDTTLVTLETLKNIVDAVDIPVCAIGGINDDNLSQIIATKVQMIGVCSALWNMRFNVLP